MLLEFTVKNFRSIKEEQTLSLLASKGIKDSQQNIIEIELPGLKGERYLKGAGIYGPNASGKTNVLKALGMMKRIVTGYSARNPAERLPYQPFALNSTYKNLPTEFFVSFVHENIRYEYEFHHNAYKVVYESLSAYPKGARQNWFTREMKALEGRPDREGTTYKASTKFKISPEVRDMTRSNALLVSVGAFLNNEQLSKVYEWFESECVILPMMDPFDNVMNSIDIISHEGSLERNQIMNLLASSDLGILGAKVDTSGSKPPINIRFSVGNDSEDNLEFREPEKIPHVDFIHSAEDGSTCLIQLEEESSGTQALFEISGVLFDVLNNGKTLVIDEIDKSLHPVLSKEILKLFFSPEVNKKGAQLIFVSHNPLFLSGELLRRDQVWFVEKDVHGASHLYPLVDFSPRKAESLLSGYLSGRYGALPVLSDFFGADRDG